MTEVEFVEVTWLRAVKVWWSLLWRTVLFVFLASAVIGFILGMIMGLFKAEPQAIITTSIIIGYIVSILIGIAVTRIVLKKEYSDFKLALIAK
jgi:ABC-type uncharacterized transport system permease subunit